MKPTIKTIAEICGVSRGTVDRVLNGRGDVSEETRIKIEDTIRKVGYTRKGAGEKSNRIKKIGFIVPMWIDGYFKSETDRGIHLAEKVIGDYHFRIETQEMESRSNAEYIYRIEKMLEDGVSGLVINAADNIIIKTQIDKVVDSGIPVVTCNADLPSSKRICHVGQDIIKSGRAAAGLMSKLLTPKDKILIITGNMEFTSHRGRVDGFCQRLDELAFSPQTYKIVECFERYEMTFDTIVNILEEDKAIKGIYMGTESVSGCIDALQKIGRNRKVHVICNDLTPQAKKNLRNGNIDFVIGQDFASQAYQSILVLHHLLTENKLPKEKQIYTDTSIITDDLIL